MSSPKSQSSDSLPFKVSSPVAAKPAAVEYGFQGMRGRMLGMSNPKLQGTGSGNNKGVGFQSVRNSKRGM